MSYSEQCIDALPPEKRQAARTAYAEISENGDDSFLSKLLVVLEANNAYAKSIPRDLAVVHDAFLNALTKETDLIRERQLKADETRDAALRKLLHQEVRLLDQTMPLNRAIHAVEEQNRTLNLLKPVILNPRLQFEMLIGGLLAGAVVGIAVASYWWDGRYKAKVAETKAAKELLDHLALGRMGLYLKTTSSGEALTVTGLTGKPDFFWIYDDATKQITGITICYPKAPVKTGIFRR